MSLTQRCVLPLLCCIIVLGFLVRIYHVDTNPAGFFCDEASIGYNAHTLLTTGQDEHGKQYPFFFQSFGDYRPPIPYYFAIPFVSVFGLNEFAVRLVTATVGTISILIGYYFLKTFLSYTHIEQKILSAGSLFGAFFLAISPWHIHMSRFGSEYIYLPLFVLLAALLFLQSFQKPSRIPVAFFASGLIGYTYLPGLIIGPVFILLMCLSFFPHLKRYWKYTLIGICIYCVLLIPTIQAVGNKTLLTRWNNVGLGKEASIPEQIKTFSLQYVEHFSPVFLFTKGDIGYPGHFINRFSVKGMGQLYIIDGLFLCIGFIFLLLQIKKKNRTAIIPIILLLLYPVGSSVTTTDGGGPLAFRSVLGSIVFPIFSAIGMAALLNTMKRTGARRLCIGLFILIYGMFFFHYLYLYHAQYPLYSQDFWGWQFGPRDIMQTFVANKNTYDEYLIIGEFNAPDIFIKFYDPTNQCANKCRIASLGDINIQRKQLIALSPQSWQQAPNLRLRIQKVIRYPNGQPAFYIGQAR
jgi:4-amino-4-deoxy-L-arabinose transferase-like glycosyltransferase